MVTITQKLFRSCVLCAALVLLLSLLLILVVRKHRAVLRSSVAAAPVRTGAPSPELESSLGLLSRSLHAPPGSRVRPPGGDASRLG